MPRHCRKRATLFVAAVISLGLSPALAQDRDALKKEAASAAAKLRAAGEPRDRCTLGAVIGDGGIVTQPVPGSALRAGDRILEANGTSLEGKSADDIIALLRSIPATSSVASRLRRNGLDETALLACSNSKANYSAILSGLDLAAKGKFDECATAFDAVPAKSGFDLTYRFQCAAASKKAETYPLGGYVHDALDAAIEYARNASTTSTPPMVFASEANSCDPFIDEPRILARAHMSRVVDPAGERKIFD